MTTAVLNSLSGSAFGGFLARLAAEFEAFFEEQGKALHRAHCDYPFGL